MKPQIPECFLKLDETKLLALCIYGEARGEPMASRLGCASVIMNRKKAGGWYGSTIRDVILKPKQFSCFNSNDPNYIGLMAIASNWERMYDKDKALRECFSIAYAVVEGDMPDNVLGATHYKTIKCVASWAASMQLVATLGHHEFYRNEEKPFKMQLQGHKVVGITLLFMIILSGCGYTIKEAQKIDAGIATYLGVKKLSLDCRAGIVKADMDISVEPVSVRHISAVMENADEESPDFKSCYNGVAWLNYVGIKIEGAIKKWAKKLVELGVIVP